jgi:hypothetical protein
MQNERDVWNTSRSHRAIRKRIGERALLAQLDEPNAETRPIAGNRSRPPEALSGA